MQDGGNGVDIPGPGPAAPTLTGDTSVASVRRVDSITGKTGAEPDLAVGTNPSRRTLPYGERQSVIQR